MRVYYSFQRATVYRGKGKGLGRKTYTIKTLWNSQWRIVIWRTEVVRMIGWRRCRSFALSSRWPPRHHRLVLGVFRFVWVQTMLSEPVSQVHLKCGWKIFWEEICKKFARNFRNLALIFNDKMMVHQLSTGWPIRSILLHCLWDKVLQFRRNDRFGAIRIKVNHLKCKSSAGQVLSIKVNLQGIAPS